jgi:hypothetical protein
VVTTNIQVVLLSSAKLSLCVCVESLLKMPYHRTPSSKISFDKADWNTSGKTSSGKADRDNIIASFLKHSPPVEDSLENVLVELV